MTQKYEMHKITDSTKVPQRDYLLMMATDEMRSYEFMLRNGDRFKNIICLLNTDEIHSTSDTQRVLKQECEKRGAIIEFGICDNSIDFKSIVVEQNSTHVNSKNLLNDYLKKISDSTIAIDISSLNITFMCRIIQIIISGMSQKIDIYYTEPENYNYEGSIFTNYAKSEGYIYIDEIQGDVNSRKQNDYYVFLLGFEGNVANRVYDELNPTTFSIINGFPAYLPKNKDISMLNNLVFVKDSKKIYYSAANNPYKTFNVLSSIYNKLDLNERMCIVPMGTKPMMFAACLFSIINKDVKLIGVKSKGYKKKTSTGVGNTWRYLLDVCVR